MLIPVILSGGAGTRLWPVSREGHPKPFMKLSDGETLMRKSYDRAAAVMQGEEILTVTNRDYFFISKDELGGLKREEPVQGTFMLEPFGRNTAPAVAIAALYINQKYGPDAKMLVLSADHLIQDSSAFAEAVNRAVELADQDWLVTFGIVPDSPATGFGYIEAGDELGKGRQVLRFVEKPDQDTAQQYLDSGRFLWNAGMFCFKSGSVIEELEKHSPDLLAQTRLCWQRMIDQEPDLGVVHEIPAELFEDVENISVDYALMERSERIAVVPADIGWSDIGSWTSVSELVEPDKDNNRSVGEAVFVGSRNNFVQSEDRLVAAVGVEDLMIVDTPDALLVAHPDQAQNVKQVVAQLKKRDHEAYRLHKTVVRPWGTYTVLEEGPRFKIKRIEVKPGASLSLQMHHHRSEHWIVVSGMAKVVNGEKEVFVRTNESTYIPAGHQHRLVNPGVLDLVLIEVQSGEYLGEDDIVRFEDDYGRS